MKYFAAILGLTIWLIFTLLLVCTIIGILVIFWDNYFKIPKVLLKVFKE